MPLARRVPARRRGVVLEKEAAKDGRQRAVDGCEGGDARSRKAELIKGFEAAIDRGEEGIMLKKADSVYQIGTRSKDWQKLKPEDVNA